MVGRVSAGAGLVATSVLVVALTGPYLRTRERPAGEPFAFEPGGGYLPDKDARRRGSPPAESPGGSPYGTKWTRPRDDEHITDAVVVTTSPSRAVLDEESLTAMAEDVAAAFADAGATWTETSRAVHLRPDGLPVLVYEGSAAHGSMVYAATQMVFAIDAGLGVVTASYAEGSAGESRAALLRAADRAGGVAFRSRPPSDRARLVWAILGAAVASLVVLISARRHVAAE